METFTKDDYTKELNAFCEQLNAKAIKHGVFKSRAGEEQEKKEKADRLEKTTESYISLLDKINKGRELIEQLKSNGYNLKFSTEGESRFTDDAIIVKVSCENPRNLSQDEINSIAQLLNKFASYHIHYNNIKEICSAHCLAVSTYFEELFQYVAVKEYCRNSNSYLPLEDVRMLMLMSGIYMGEMGYKIGKDDRIGRRLKRALQKFKNCLIKTETNYGNTAEESEQ